MRVLPASARSWRKGTPERRHPVAGPVPRGTGGERVIYRIARPPEYPERVRERIESGAYEKGLGLGPEAVLALGFAGVAALAALPEISAAAVESYAALILRLTAAATAAGQAIPQFARAP